MHFENVTQVKRTHLTIGFGSPDRFNGYSPPYTQQQEHLRRRMSGDSSRYENDPFKKIMNYC